MTTREEKEQEIAFSDEDMITRMMKVLEHRWYVDTDRWSENTFEEDVRPLFEKMMKAEQPKQEAISKMETADIDKIMEDIENWTRKWIMKFSDIENILRKHLIQKTTVPNREVNWKDIIYDEIMSNLKTAEYCRTCWAKKNKLEMWYFTCDNCKINET